MDLPEKVYTERDVDRARRHGKVVGWVQGGVAVIVGGMVLNLVGWIPTVLIVGGGAYVAYRLLRPRAPATRGE